MSVTPQTNTDLASLASRMLEWDNFVICGHVSPDGDCIGSQLGLMHALRSVGKKVTCLLAKDEPIDRRLTFLPGVEELMFAASYTGDKGVFIAVDVPNRDRMNSAAARLVDSCEHSITIDHHAADKRMTELAYVDPDSASTTMLVWQLAHLLEANCAGSVALCCYTGIVTDTGRFQYQNTDSKALSIAAEMVASGADPAMVSRHIFQNRSFPSIKLEVRAFDRMRLGRDSVYALSWLERRDYSELDAVKADGEPIIDSLRSLRGVRVACMLRDQGNTVRGSFRAKDDTDVAAFARSFGGGGHRAAAGFTIAKPIDAAIPLIEAFLSKELEAEETPMSALDESGREEEQHA